MGKEVKRKSKKNVILILVLILLVICVALIIFMRLATRVVDLHPFGNACYGNDIFIIDKNSCYMPQTGEILLGVKGVKPVSPIDFVGIGFVVRAIKDDKYRDFFLNATKLPYARMYNGNYNEEIDFPFLYGNFNESYYVINVSDFENIKEAMIATIVKIGNTQKVCNFVAKTEIKECSYGTYDRNFNS